MLSLALTQVALCLIYAAMQTANSRKEIVKCVRALIIEKNGQGGRNRTVADNTRSAYALFLVILLLDS
jgi:uncharacterized MAPEG superfamily protein